MEAGDGFLWGSPAAGHGSIATPAPATPRIRVCQRGSSVATSSRYSCVVARKNLLPRTSGSTGLSVWLAKVANALNVEMLSGPVEGNVEELPGDCRGERRGVVGDCRGERRGVNLDCRGKRRGVNGDCRGERRGVVGGCRGERREVVGDCRGERRGVNGRL